MTIRNLTDLQTTRATGDRDLGAFVYWNGLNGIRVPRAVFRAEFERLGLGAALGRDPKAEACLNMAVGVAVRRQKRDVVPGKITLKSKGTHAVYAVLMRRDFTAPAAAGGDERVRYIEEARIILDRSQPSPNPTIVTASDVGPDDVREALIDDVVREYHDILAHIRTTEASEALARAMGELDALSLRPGTYFVAPSKTSAVRELKAFFAAIGTTDEAARISIWDLAATSGNVDESRQEARATLTDKVKAVIEEAKTFADAKGDDITTKSINARVKRFTELDGQAALYADILGDYADELRATIEAARVAFKAAVIGP